MGTGLWVGRTLSQEKKELRNKIESLELLLADKAHCKDCKFIDTIYCGGLLDRDTLEVPDKNTPVFCSNFILEDKKFYFNKYTIAEVKEKEAN